MEVNRSLMLDLVRPRTRFYRRPWFLAMGTLCLIVLVAGSIWALIEKQYWEGKAREFDYSHMSEMESASVIYDRKGTLVASNAPIFVVSIVPADLKPALEADTYARLSKLVEVPVPEMRAAVEKLSLIHI